MGAAKFSIRTTAVQLGRMKIKTVGFMREGIQTPYGQTICQVLTFGNAAFDYVLYDAGFLSDANV